MTLRRLVDERHDPRKAQDRTELEGRSKRPVGGTVYRVTSWSGTLPPPVYRSVSRARSRDETGVLHPRLPQTLLSPQGRSNFCTVLPRTPYCFFGWGWGNVFRSVSVFGTRDVRGGPSPGRPRRGRVGPFRVRETEELVGSGTGTRSERLETGDRSRGGLCHLYRGSERTGNWVYRGSDRSSSVSDGVWVYKVQAQGPRLGRYAPTPCLPAGRTPRLFLLSSRGPELGLTDTCVYP